MCVPTAGTRRGTTATHSERASRPFLLGGTTPTSGCGARRFWISKTISGTDGTSVKHLHWRRSNPIRPASPLHFLRWRCRRELITFQVLRTFACIPPPSLLTPTNHYNDFAPRGETTCLAGYLKAIGLAQNYIYIEDQYLVSEELARALNRALNTANKLIILVPSATDGFPEAAFNFHQDRFLRIVTAGHPGKVHIYNPVQPTTGLPIYVHSKVMIIDDVYAVVGSPNINRRGSSHDTELAAAVVDSDVVDGVCRFARDLRRTLWGEHLNVPVGDTSIADPIVGVAEWERQASAATFRVRRHVTPTPQTEFPQDLGHGRRSGWQVPNPGQAVDRQRG